MNLEEEIQKQKDLLDVIYYQLMHQEDHLVEVNYELERLRLKYKTELNHYSDLIVERDMSKLRDDAIQQLKGN